MQTDDYNERHEENLKAIEEYKREQYQRRFIDQFERRLEKQRWLREEKMRRRSNKV